MAADSRAVRSTDRQRREEKRREGRLNRTRQQKCDEKKKRRTGKKNMQNFKVFNADLLKFTSYYVIQFQPQLNFIKVSGKQVWTSKKVD